MLHYGRPGTGLRARAGHDLHRRADDQRRQAGIRELADGWTIVTKDHSLSAQWEHTVLVTETGYEVLTQSAGAPPRRSRSRPLESSTVPRSQPTPARRRTASELRQRARRGRAALRCAYKRGRRAPLPRRTAARRRTLRALWREPASRQPRWSPPAATAAASSSRAPTSTCSCCCPTRASRARGAIERSIGRLWDIGLEIGHSVRTVEECVEAAADDITIQTTLLEARLLAGSRAPVRAAVRRLHDALDPQALLQGEAARAGAAPRQAPGRPTSSSPT